MLFYYHYNLIHFYRLKKALPRHGNIPATLTILSIFIGIVAVMTIVSVMEGMKLQVMKQFNAMGANRIEVQIEVYSSDESGNSAGVDYFPKLYSYCQGLACFFG